MKKTVLTLTFLLILRTLFAQTWAPIGAKWYYTSGWSQRTYLTFESIGDSVFQSRQCKVIRERGLGFDTTQYFDYFMYSSLDSVFVYEVSLSKFCLLYVFNAQPGDTIYMECYHNLKLWVTSVDTVNYNGIPHKVLHVSHNSMFEGFWGENIEGIGNNTYMFPQGDGYVNGPLRCYRDSSGFIQFLPIACDSILSNSINAINFSEISMDIYPNPAESRLSIQVDIRDNAVYSINIFSYNGQKIIFLQDLNKRTNEISIDKLEGGLYLIQVVDKNGNFTEKKFIKE